MEGGREGCGLSFPLKLPHLRTMSPINNLIVANCSHYIICYFQLDMIEFFALLSESVCIITVSSKSTGQITCSCVVTIIIIIIFFFSYILNRGYYMAAWGYEFYLLVLKVSLTRSLRSLVRDTFSTRR